jgi:CHAD domain-containing protein
VEEQVVRRVFLDAPAGFEALASFGEPVDERVFTTTLIDAEDRILGSTGLSLTRRLENGKSTWELELPANGRTRTVSDAGGPTRPPRGLSDLLAGVLRDRAVGPVATHRTRRSTRRARENGHDVALVALDSVAIMDGRKVASRLSRIDVGLMVDERGAEKRLVKVLKKGGASRRRDEDDRGPKVARRPPLEQIRDMLERQLREILRHDPGTRLGSDPEDLHRMRVATRRARAVLRAGGPLLDSGWSEPLREELGWLGSALGQVRDLDVLLAHLDAQMGELDKEERFAAKRISQGLDRERAEARGALLEVLESERYAALLDSLGVAAPPPPEKPSGAELPALAKAEFKSLKNAARSLGPDTSDEDLHRVRVKAKRARYAAELAAPSVGKRAEDFVRSAKRFQDLLGEHQDAVVAEKRIRELATTARATKVAFAAGRLVERERARRASARAEVPEAWSKLERSGRRAGFS